jgi:hypothetical protein
MRSLYFRIVLVVIAMAIAASAAAQEVQYVNLTPGALNIFHKAAQPNYELRRWVTQETDEYSVVRWDLYNDGVFLNIEKESWKSIDESGDVWGHGIYGIPCTPAYKSIDAPLAVGNTWESTVQYGDLGEMHFAYECTGEEEVTVPEGTFHCFVVRCDWFIGDVNGVAIHYYCEGVGEVKWVDGGIVYDLKESRTLEYMNLDTSLPRRSFTNRSDGDQRLLQSVLSGTADYMSIRTEFRDGPELMSLRNYHMSADEEGDVWLHGRDNSMADPLILEVDAPLYVGKTWEGTSHWFDLDVSFVTTCTAEETIEIPAGIFHCFVVEQVILGVEGTSTSWYCEGIGRVKRLLSGWDDFELFDGIWELEDPVVPVAEDMPAVTLLAQNYPNPFNPMTTIAYSLRADGPITLTVFDLAGRRVRRLVDGGCQIAGEHHVVWDGRNDAEGAMPSGIYFYRLVADGREVSRTMTLVR